MSDARIQQLEALVAQQKSALADMRQQMSRYPSMIQVQNALRQAEEENTSLRAQLTEARNKLVEMAEVVAASARSPRVTAPREHAEDIAAEPVEEDETDPG